MSELSDRDEIRQLLATYTIEGDRGRVDRLVMVFAQDGILQTGIWRAEGREGIVKALSRPTFRTQSPESQTPRDRGRVMRHHLTSSLITLDGPDAATGRTYWINYSEKGTDHSGLYADRYRRIDGRWHIVYRDVRIDWKAPDSWTSPDMVAGPRPADAPPLPVIR
jgi:hypothetical protein